MDSLHVVPSGSSKSSSRSASPGRLLPSSSSSHGLVPGNSSSPHSAAVYVCFCVACNQSTSWIYLLHFMYLSELFVP